MIETTHQIASRFLANERPVWFLRKRAPEQLENVVVFLDAEFYRERMGAVATCERLAVEWGPSLFVFVSHRTLADRWVECPCHASFAHFVADELLPWIEERHPGARAASRRVLVGVSYTGLAAAFVALEAPGIFTHTITQSGSFWWNDGWLSRQVAPPVATRFYLEVGTRETQTNVRHKEDVVQEMSQVEGVRRFRDALVAAGNSPTYVEFDGGHEFQCWERTLPDALRWLSD